ncbi:MAG: TIGR04283 family arsenosugar biosynthesis glycosyltransferase [Pseudomonadota bacterium]
MVSVIIPTLNAERMLVPTLAALVPAAADGLIRDVVIADGGSSDETKLIADEAGCTVVSAPRGRGPQLAEGAKAARSDWLLFLHADTVLDDNWQKDVATFVEREMASGRGPRAATFRFQLADPGWRPRLLERLVALRCALFALPYGDQGLLIHRSLYRSVGGFRDLPLMEDVDMVRRIGRGRLTTLRTAATTSAERYLRDGYFRRMLRNLTCLTLYFLRVPPSLIIRFYG